MLQTWFLKISLHPYYSSRIGWNILLYESLWFTILVCLRAFFLENWKNIQKIEFLNFFLSSLFFWMKWLFYRPRRERQRQAERQRKIFLLLLLFLCILTWKFDPTLKISIFEKLSKLIIFLIKMWDLRPEFQPR